MQDAVTQAPAEDLPPPGPESVLPQTEDWLAQAGMAADPIAPAPPPPKARGKLGLRTKGRRTVMALALAGIGVLGYLNFASKPDIPDMLGADLPSIAPEQITAALPQVEPVDPRLLGADLTVEGLPDFLAEPETLDQRMAEAAPGAQQTLEGLPLAAPAEAAPAPSQMPLSAASVSAPAPEMVTPNAAAGDAELLARLQRMELLLAQLQKQLEQQAARASVPAAAVSAPAPAPAPRPVAKAAAPAATITASTAKPSRKDRKTASANDGVAAQPAPKLSGQLVSVDMWNGQPSVVVASGLPGDRRIRVLRPGDVVNGLALRSADPVTQSATFAVPGSAGLTLYVSQGG